jgi:alpha-beta hydrolase superfamily lysophospholipase
LKIGLFIMHQSIETFLSPIDGISIYAQSWLPEESPRGVVVLVHGYAEHSGRYHHVATTIANAGYGAYALDHRGHGHSDGLRAYFNSIEEPVADLEYFVKQIQAKHPQAPLFMVGHSMGSMIALWFTLRRQQELSGLILSGTAITSPETIPGYQRSLVNLLRRFAPTFALVPPLSADALSTDPATIRDYDADPLNYRGSWRVGLAAELLNTADTLRARAAELTLPLLIMHGEQDEVTPISGAHYIYGHAASTDKTLKTYPGMKHEIFNELDRGKVLAELREWLQAH